jgi:cytochrome c nitrite reductase small subunit
LNFLKKFLCFFIPPDSWKLPVAVILGILVGLALFIIRISNAPAYLSDDPETCINCHVMYPQYASWFHSSHHNVATCNDCHVPHNNFANKYYFKAKDGMRHASIFTMRREPQVIQIKEASQGVVQENCKRCHADLISMINLTEVTADNSKEGKGHRCWDCHRSTPHGEVNSLASYPFALVPRPESVAPEWLDKYLKSKDKK